MTARNEQARLRIDNDNLKIPEAANLPPDRSFVTSNQVEGVDNVDSVDLSRARNIVLGEDEDSDLPINTDAYLPSSGNAADLPMPLYVVPKEDEIINLRAEDRVNDEVEVVDEENQEQVAPEIIPVQPDATVPIRENVPVAEVKVNDCPVDTVTPETAPIVAKWYDRVFDRAVKALDTTRAYFNPPKEPTAEVLQLREQRRKLHEASAKMFSKDKTAAHEARQNFVGTELNLAGKKYTVESFVAQGSFGSTFIARDAEDIQRIVKITKPFDRSAMFYKDVTPTPDEQVKATEPRAAILEVAALDSLSYVNINKDDPTKPYIKEINPSNPGPRLIDAQFVPHPDDTNQRLSVIVMEYVPGVSLTKFMAENKTEPLNVVEAVTQVVDKLLSAHNAGIVHSDIKPANIIVNRDASGNVSAKLIDFGAAIIQNLRSSQDANSPKQAVLSRIERLLGKKPAQKPIYAQEASQLVSPNYVKANETATVFRDRYSLGRSIQNMVFGKDFRDPARMEELVKDLPYPKRQLARIAEQLTRSNPRERISLTQARRLLDELKTTEQGIEQIQDQIPA